jgi:hypothetical protein
MLYVNTIISVIAVFIIRRDRSVSEEIAYWLEGRSRDFHFVTPYRPF